MQAQSKYSSLHYTIYNVKFSNNYIVQICYHVWRFLALVRNTPIAAGCIQVCSLYVCSHD